MKGEIVGKFRRIVEIDVPQPCVDAGEEDALADRLNEITVLDALGRGMRPASDSRLGNHAQHGFGHGVDVPGPDRVIGLKAGLGAADTVRLVEKLDERFRNGDRARDIAQARYQDDGPAVAVDLPGRKSERLREFAAGVMEQTAKSSALIRRLILYGFNKRAALRLVEKEPLSLFVEYIAA